MRSVDGKAARRLQLDLPLAEVLGPDSFRLNLPRDRGVAHPRDQAGTWFRNCPYHTACRSAGFTSR